MRHVRPLLLLALALGLAGAGIWVWQSIRFPARAEQIPATPIVLHAQPAVPAAELALIRDGIEISAAYLREGIGHRFSSPVTVRVARTDGCEPFVASGARAVGWFKPGLVCVDTGHRTWRMMARAGGAGRRMAWLVPAHELVHVAQAELGCAPGPGRHGFRWLVEGMAVHLSWQAAIAGGRAARPDALTAARRMGAGRRGLHRLAAYERAGGGDPEYALWHLAVRRLAAGDDHRLASFCAAVGRGTGWRAAFARAFGRTVQDFYAGFERDRRRGDLMPGRAVSSPG